MVARSVRQLADKYGVTQFEFVDDALSPTFADGFARAIRRLGLGVTWAAYARLDSRFDFHLLRRMRRSGCVALKYGLESASPEVLRVMGKGISPRGAEITVCRTAAVDIIPQVAFFVGFPGETSDDMERTLEFVTRHVVSVGCVAFNGQFRLMRSMPVFRNPHKYGIARISKWNKEEDLMDYFQFRNVGGPSPREILNKCARYEAQLASAIRFDAARTVDLRRYWHSVLEPKELGEPAPPRDQRSCSAAVVFDLSRVQPFTDIKRGDFAPGTGLYSTRSYVADGALCSTHSRAIAGLIGPLKRISRRTVSWDVMTEAFEMEATKGDERKAARSRIPGS